MGIFNTFFWRGKPKTKAVYDAAQRTSRNRVQWRGADFLNADQSMSASVRKVLRSRARYEVGNNSWLEGMILQFALDVVNTGAKLQITSANDADANAIEREFQAWAKSVKLYRKLRTAIQTEIRDGEAFLELLNNPKVQNECKLYPMLIDAERVCSPMTDIDTDDDNQVDGIYLDKWQEPVSYSVAITHPSVGIDDKHATVPAEYMCHMYREEQPEQHRGIPQITSALPSISMLRAYTIAMLNKMENSADAAGVLKPSSADIETDELSDPPFSEFDLPSRSWITLPAGYDLQQFELQNPTDSQSNFALSVKLETARCILATKNVVLGDSSSYNYSSARMDVQTYYDGAIRVRRQELEDCVLDKVFRQWWAETHPNEDLPRYVWYWNQRGYINPVQETQAEANRMSNGNATYQQICAEQGKDWQLLMRQKYEAEKYRRALGKEYGFDLDCGPAFVKSEQEEGNREEQ